MKTDFFERLKKVSPLQWAKGLLVALAYVLFIIWHGNYWWILLLPVFLDAFTTRYIPWDAWKNVKNKTLRGILGWVDAILFAVVACYFVFTYFFQNYQIPTSSLEKTLLVGDFLLVSKASYGPRVPMTPLSFPFAQHTMPVFETKSYIEKPQWKYRRLKGFKNIERNDIVVFNFPTGDTVALKVQNPDYYTLCHYYGREAVWKHQKDFGEIVYRPVDRRENYVKRCVALPGETFEMRDTKIYIDGVEQPHFRGVQQNYYIQTNGTYLSNEILTKMDISKEDRILLPNRSNLDLISFLNFDPELPIYQIPLTEENLRKMKLVSNVVQVKREPVLNQSSGSLYPLGLETRWDVDNYGPIYMPKKGDDLKLTKENLPVYERIITAYEGNKLEIKNDIIYINGEATTSYKVKMDYYWMLGDNRHKSADSRFWGYVPEDHIVGRPVFVWLSLDKDKPWFGGKIRWNRFFKSGRR